MNFIEFLGIALAPSLTLGLVVFFAKNWLLERLKNSIKYEYDKSLEKFKGDLKYNNDKSLEKFKGDLKIENDKEIEEIKALLKNKTDVSLEDYRFQIEIRKKWLDDLRNLSSKYLETITECIQLCDTYILNDQIAIDSNAKDENFKECVQNIYRLNIAISNISFQLELLLSIDDWYRNEIKHYMDSVTNWFGKKNLENNIMEKKTVDYESEKMKELKSYLNNFKNKVLELHKLKSEKL